jgi:hydroxymethylbilane synthase
MTRRKIRNVNESIRIGTRASLLALRQANWVKARLEEAHPGVEVTLVHIKTEGDRIEVPLFKFGGKGLFIKEIEEALQRGEVDLAVHSAKDLPAEIPDELQLVACPGREDPRDVLISRSGKPWQAVPGGGKVGTGSPRRKAQLLRLRPDLEIVPLRGNLDTRIKKLAGLELDAIVLAAAGLKRLGWDHQISGYFDLDEMIPAIGQGTLSLECREQDERIRRLVSFLNHEATAIELMTERAFLRKLGGGCQIPIAGVARVQGGMVRIRGLVCSIDGKRMVQGIKEGPRFEGRSLGEQLGEELLAAGGADILREVYELQ